MAHHSRELASKEIGTTLSDLVTATSSKGKGKGNKKTMGKKDPIMVPSKALTPKYVSP
jgi:hypothetical protein